MLTLTLCAALADPLYELLSHDRRSGPRPSAAVSKCYNDLTAAIVAQVPVGTRMPAQPGWTAMKHLVEGLKLDANANSTIREATVQSWMREAPVLVPWKTANSYNKVRSSATYSAIAIPTQFGSPDFKWQLVSRLVPGVVAAPAPAPALPPVPDQDPYFVAEAPRGKGGKKKMAGKNLAQSRLGEVVPAALDNFLSSGDFAFPPTYASTAEYLDYIYQIYVDYYTNATPFANSTTYFETAHELITIFFGHWAPSSILAFLAAPHFDLPLEIYATIPELQSLNQGVATAAHDGPSAYESIGSGPGNEFVYVKGVSVTIKELVAIRDGKYDTTLNAEAMASTALERFKRLAKRGADALLVLDENPNGILDAASAWEVHFRSAFAEAAARMDAMRVQQLVQILHGGKYRTGRHDRLRTEALDIDLDIDRRRRSFWSILSRLAWERGGQRTVDGGENVGDGHWSSDEEFGSNFEELEELKRAESERESESD